MLDSEQIKRIGRDILPNFDGVYPINQLPITYKRKYVMIINTDPDNLPGKHWIAVIVRYNREAFVFDPLGFPPPLKLQHWFIRRNIRWSCNTRQVQSSLSTLCGYYCIYFLWFATSNTLNDEHFVNIMNILFPVKNYDDSFDSIINDFANNLKI